VTLTVAMHTHTLPDLGHGRGASHGNARVLTIAVDPLDDPVALAPQLRERRRNAAAAYLDDVRNLFCANAAFSLAARCGSRDYLSAGPETARLGTAHR
jgi:hypothetical protein